MLHEISVAIVQMTGRDIQLKSDIAKLERLRDKVSKSIPEKMKN